MKRIIIICCLILFPSLHAWDEDDDDDDLIEEEENLQRGEECLCGRVSADPNYAKAVSLLGSSIPGDFRYSYPRDAREFCPPRQLYYPSRGKITWDIVNIEYLKRDRDSSLVLSETPIKIKRTREWTDSFENSSFEHKEKQAFVFKKDYSAVPHIFQILRKDVATWYDESEFFLDARLKDLENNVKIQEPSEWGFSFLKLTNKKNLLEKKEKIQKSRQKATTLLEQNETEALKACCKSLDRCIAKHQNPIANLDRGLFYYLEGSTLDALDQIEKTLKRIKEKDLEKLKEKTLLLKGLAELESGYYADAVLTLTELIQNNPTNKEAYFERAVAYFETGEFEKSLSDYLQSKTEEPEVHQPNSFSFEYASGLAEGIGKGFQEEFSEHLPAWASMMALSLWSTFNNAPIPHAKIVSATLTCIAAAGIYLAADQMVGELKELVTNWEQLSERERGHVSGYIIGKYGIDVFTCAGSVKLAEAYRTLKKANQAFTFELALADEANVAGLKRKYQKIEKFNQDQAHIQRTFGRNFHPELEIRDNLKKMGYNVPKASKGIPESCVTRYSDGGCGINYCDPQKPNYNVDRFMPGTPHSPNQKQQKPYVKQMRDGHYLDAEGNKVRAKAEEAHISPEDYVFRPWDYKPKEGTHVP